MNKVKEIKPQEVLSNYSGSEATYKMVAEQIAERFGKKEAKNYDPYKNCMTYKQWIANNFRVKKGEKAIKSVTYVKVENETGETGKCYPRTVNLFYKLQVEPINK